MLDTPNPRIRRREGIGRGALERTSVPGSHSEGALRNFSQTLCGSLSLWDEQEKAEGTGLGP